MSSRCRGLDRWIGLGVRSQGLRRCQLVPLTGSGAAMGTIVVSAGPVGGSYIRDGPRCSLQCGRVGRLASVSMTQLKSAS